MLQLIRNIYTCQLGNYPRWSFSLNFLSLMRAPIVSGQPTKNIWQTMKRKDFNSLKKSAGKFEPTYWEKTKLR